MKRKRFVKLAMSYGVQRNEAERLAKLVCVLGSYEGVFAHYRLYLEGRRATMALRRVYKSVEVRFVLWWNAYGNFLAA